MGERFVASGLHLTPLLSSFDADLGRKFLRECEAVHTPPIFRLRNASRSLSGRSRTREQRDGAADAAQGTAPSSGRLTSHLLLTIFRAVSRTRIVHAPPADPRDRDRFEEGRRER